MKYYFDNMLAGEHRPADFLKKAVFNKEILERYDRELFVNYIIYDNSAKQGYCTACNRYFEGQGFRKNELHRCPHCRKEYALRPRGNAAWMQRNFIGMSFAYRGGVAIVYCLAKFEYGRQMAETLKGYGTLSKSYEPFQINFFTDKGHEQFKYIMGWYYESSGWKREGGMHIPMVSSMCFNNVIPTYIDLKMLELVLPKTHLRYCKDIICDKKDVLELHTTGTMKMMEACRRHPSLELLYRQGAYNLVLGAITTGTGKTVNWAAKTLERFFKLNDRKTIGLACKLNLHADKLRGVQLAEKQGWHIHTDEEMETLRKHFNLETYRLVERHGGTVKDYITFMERQKIAARFSYQDYIRQAEQLGYDLRDKRYLYPRYLKAAHDRVSEEYRIAQDVLEQERIRKEQVVFDGIVESISKYAFSKCGFEIRPARSNDELIAEGRELHHCVASYYSKMRDGKTWIFVIRQTSEPDSPFYTLEMSPQKKVQQCRGAHNRSTTAELDTFILDWEDHVAKVDRDQRKANRKAISIRPQELVAVGI